MKKLYVVKLLIAAAVQLVTVRAFATDYAAGLSANVNASHNDNIRFTKNEKTSVRKYDAAPTLTFSASTETTNFEIDSTFDFNRYDKSEFNSDDQNIAMALSRQFESSSLSLKAAYINNSTITSELLTSGRIGEKAERAEQYQLSPQWTYSISELNLLQVQASYTAQDYHSAAYLGYKNIGSEIDWIHVANERLRWVTALTYSDYHSDETRFGVPGSGILYPSTDPSDPGTHFATPFGSAALITPNQFGDQSYSTRTKDIGFQIGLDYQWSEQSLMKARFGRSKSDTTYPVKDLNDTCANPDYLRLVQLGLGSSVGAICDDVPRVSEKLSTAELDWTWSNERQQFNLNSTKSTQPSSNGYTVDALQVGLNWSYHLTELDRISTMLSVARNRAPNKTGSLQNGSIADRDYGSATVAYERQISEFWFLNTSFQFSEQKYTQIDYQSSARVFSLGINYRPQQWHWSR